MNKLQALGITLLVIFAGVGIYEGSSWLTHSQLKDFVQNAETDVSIYSVKGDDSRIDVIIKNQEFDYYLLRITKDENTLKAGNFIASQWDTLTEYSRTYFDINTIKDTSICSRITKTRCYVENYYERNNRKTNQIKIYQRLVEPDMVIITKEIPFYKGKTGSDGILYEDYIITKNKVKLEYRYNVTNQAKHNVILRIKKENTKYLRLFDFIDPFGNFVKKDNNLYYYGGVSGNLIIDPVWYIAATDAEHLDSNKKFIKDVFDEIKEIDGIYAEIPVGDYVRVTFEENITNANFIKFVVAGDFNSTRWYGVEAYQEDKFLGEVDINFNKTTYVTIPELEGKEDIFDLRIYRKDWIESSYYDEEKQIWFDNSSWTKSYSGGSLLFDYIEDDVNVTGCGATLNTADETYLMNESLTCSGNGFEIAANNITLDCQGFELIGSATGNGINFAAVRDNFVLKNCNIKNFSRGLSTLSAASPVNNWLITNNNFNTTVTGGVSMYFGTHVNDTILSHNYFHNPNEDVLGLGATRNFINFTLFNNTYEYPNANWRARFNANLYNINVEENRFLTVGGSGIQTNIPQIINNYTLKNNFFNTTGIAFILEASVSARNINVFNNTIATNELGSTVIGNTLMVLGGIQDVVVDNTWFSHEELVITAKAISIGRINNTNITIRNLKVKTGVFFDVLSSGKIVGLHIYNNTINMTGSTQYILASTNSNVTNVLIESNINTGRATATQYSLGLNNNNITIRNEKLNSSNIGIGISNNLSNILIQNVSGEAPNYFYHTGGTLTNVTYKDSTLFATQNSLFSQTSANDGGELFFENLNITSTGGRTLRFIKKVNVTLKNITYTSGFYEFTNTNINVISDYGIVSFNNVTQSYLTRNFGNDVQVNDNNIFVNSTAATGLNVSANLTFYNVTGFTNPTPYRNGAPCVGYCGDLIDLGSDDYAFNVSSFTDYSVGETLDSEAPQYSNIINPSNGEYIDNPFCFNITWTDNNIFNEAHLNLSSELYLMDDLGSDKYGLCITLPAGTHDYTYIGKDTIGNTNQTDEYELIIAQSTPNLTLVSSAGWTITPDSSTTITGNCTGDLTCELFLNNSLIANPYTAFFPEANYVFKYNTTGNTNWTSSSLTKTLKATTSTGGGCDYMLVIEWMNERIKRSKWDKVIGC
jgi:hypothetical protein